MRELSNIEFAGSADADASRLSKQLKSQNFTQISSREATAKPHTNSTSSHDSSSSSLIFKVQAQLELDEACDCSHKPKLVADLSERLMCWMRHN